MKRRAMMKRVPNVMTRSLGLIAILMAAYTVFTGTWAFSPFPRVEIQDQNPLLWLNLAGLVIIWLDGFIATHFDAMSEEGEHLQSLYGGILGSTSVAILLLTRAWPITAVVIMAVFFGFLQLIHELAVRNVRWVYPLKAWQHWMHPLFATIVYVATTFEYVAQAEVGEVFRAWLILVMAFGLLLKKPYLDFLIHDGKHWRQNSSATSAN